MFKRITIILTLCFLFGNVFSLCFVNSVEATEFKPQVTVGDFKSGVNTTVDGTTLGKYIREIYKYSLGFVGILACAVLMFGGFSWITAGGNGERIGNAKSWIGAALSGLVLMLCSYTLLYMVNPDLVSFKPLDVREVDGKTSTDSGGSEESIRSRLGAMGVTVNNANPCEPSDTECIGCTSLAGLPENAIGGISNINDNMDESTLRVTGGTECGHVTHGPGKASVDFGVSSELDQYFREATGGSLPINTYVNASGDNSSVFKRVRFEGDHYHVEF